MASRFVITGVQLGMLQTLVKLGKTSDALEMLDEIQENQYSGFSSCDIKADAILANKKLFKENPLAYVEQDHDSS
jgi:pentatricopeptide repeat protein